MVSMIYHDGAEVDNKDDDDDAEDDDDDDDDYLWDWSVSEKDAFFEVESLKAVARADQCLIMMIWS